MHVANGLEHFRAQATLEEEPKRACFERADRLHVAVIGREHEDPGVGKLGAYGRDGFDASQARHLQIHQRDVGLEFAEAHDRFGAVARFADKRHVRLRFEDRGDAVAQHRMVVDDENADRGVLSHWRPSLRARSATASANASHECAPRRRAVPEA